jgi:hypothetical protein
MVDVTKNRVRQILLFCVAAVLLFEAGVALVNPGLAAARVGYEISGPDGLSEYRAVYLGMFGALGIAMLFAARNVAEPLVADVICLAIAAEAVARLVGVVIDGVPGNVHLLNIAAESCAVLILMIRPSPPRPPA